uniref:Putative condensation domain-containing protein n=1 Tax=Serratia plymuthica TaxID=82996 RepID=T2I4I0_SERPL|nr:putative condensation domain-containing protein [Serratia plymuthica RVH1]
MSVHHDVQHARSPYGDEWASAAPQEGVVYPLGYAQHCFWFVAATLGDTANNQSCIQIEGELQPALLERVLGGLIAHHPILRSAISRWAPTQRIQPVGGFDLPFADLTGETPVQAQQHVKDVARRLLAEPFDLQRPPLLRAQLFRLQPQQHVLVLCFPHIVADGAAVHLFCQQLWQRYRLLARGDKLPLAGQAEMPFTALIASERARYRRHGSEDQRFWRRHLQGYPWATFPQCYVNQQQTHASDRYVSFPADSYERLESVARQHKVSLQMVLLALIGRVVREMTGASRFALNSVLEGRDRPGSESLMAPLLRVMPVPLDMNDAPTFPTLLAQGAGKGAARLRTYRLSVELAGWRDGRTTLAQQPASVNAVDPCRQRDLYRALPACSPLSALSSRFPADGAAAAARLVPARSAKRRCRRSDHQHQYSPGCISAESAERRG